MSEDSPNGVIEEKREAEKVEEAPAEDLVVKSADVTMADIDSLITKFPNIRPILAEIVLSRMLVEARAENAELKKPRAQKRREKAEKK